MAEIVAVPAALPDWAEGLVNLASPRFGTRAVSCSDDSFAAMERMLEDGPAVFARLRRRLAQDAADE